MEDTSNLNPCKLGTKDYWESAYDLEIKNYQDNGDTGEKCQKFNLIKFSMWFIFLGEIWFEESSQYRIIKWLNKNEIAKDTSILDLGNYFIFVIKVN